MTDQSEQLTILAGEAKKGSLEAANRIVSLLHKEVFLMIYYRTYSPEDAEDLTQEVFIKMFRGINKLVDAEKIRPWIFSIALNRVRDFKRWKRLETLFGRSHDDIDKLCDERSTPDEEMTRVELLKKVKSFTENLPKGERQVFMLRFIDKLGIAEIALTLGKNESTVKTHLYRAIRKFREDSDLKEMVRGGEL